MKSFNLYLILSLFCLSTNGYSGTDNPEKKSARTNPNIVFIIADDLGYSDLGCFGGEVITPNLDQLAARGVRFSNFHNAAKCEPTRAALMSGHRNTPEVGFMAERAESFLPAIMKANGYSTLMAGKWHVSGHPLSRGFDRFFGHKAGASNFWTGSGRIELDHEHYTPGEDYYSTDAFTDFAIQFLEENKEDDKNQPFFLYLAYTAPHSPLQAPVKDIARYRGKYLSGWNQIKQKRFDRVIEEGLVPPGTKLTPWPENLPDWNELSDAQKDMEDYRMATYAAMTDRMDQNIGRVFDWLKSNGEWDNTIIIFISDNGSSPFDRRSVAMINEGILPGDPDSNWSLGTGWAHVSNTPYRLYKRNMHEGGICAPMIMYWPGSGYHTGTVSHLPVNILDFLPTFHALGGGETRPPGIEGTDLSDLWISGAQNRDYEIMGYLADHRYIQQNNWKLVSMDGQPWELFDLSVDRNETNDLSSGFQNKASEMEASWETWYAGFSNISFLDSDKNEKKLGKMESNHMGDRGTGVTYTPVEMPLPLDPEWPAYEKLNLGGKNLGEFLEDLPTEK
ncbi:MAG: arylsulfatase [Bacteroidales bacterium]|nr:arylsulfatase [Bacteroidales bacterium]